MRFGLDMAASIRSEKSAVVCRHARAHPQSSQGAAQACGTSRSRKLPLPGRPVARLPLEKFEVCGTSVTNPSEPARLPRHGRFPTGREDSLPQPSTSFPWGMLFQGFHGENVVQGSLCQYRVIRHSQVMFSNALILAYPNMTATRRINFVSQGRKQTMSARPLTCGSRGMCNLIRRRREYQLFRGWEMPSNGVRPASGYFHTARPPFGLA